MKSISYKILVVIALAFVVIACSTKRDSLLNRKFHALTTEYNVLFNGQEAFDKYYVDLINSYKDNYWQVLPIEPFIVKNIDQNIDPNEKPSGDLARAEEKATKAIQKHSMYIDGQERNPQMDEAYLLLGKARYYENRFLPAIEAYNYIIYKSPESNTLDEIIVWREKANIHLKNNEDAIDNLKELIETPNKQLSRELLVDAKAVMAQAYININVIDTAIIELTTSRNLTKNKEKKARFSFILGQLHKELKQLDSANYYFQEVIDMNRKAKRMYTMQAYAQQASLFNYETGDTVAFLKKFNKLLEDRENRPYLYILTHQLGNFYKHYKNYDKAIIFYNESIKNNEGKDQYMLASNYRELGQINFDQRHYKKSAKYYDSCLTSLPNPSKEYIAIQRKAKNVDEVIKYEDIISYADSTIHIYNMTEPERVAYFSEYIDKLKQKDTEIALKAKQEEAKLANIAAAQGQIQTLNTLASDRASITPASGGFAMPIPGGSDYSGGQSTFYYYIPTSVQQGKLTFERKWGKRQLKDNWRWLSAASSVSTTQDTDSEIALNDTKPNDQDNQLIDLENPKYNLSTYLDKVVTQKDSITSLVKNRNAAYYELGYIYADKFQEYQLAANRLESLLNSDPEKGLILPTYYNLFKIYTKLNSTKATDFRDKILNNYPDTHYAKVLQGIVSEKTDNPETVYTQVYTDYLKNNNPVKALDEVDEKIDFYIGTPIVAKYELLRARLLAKTQGVIAYKNALNNIVKLYPLTEEGKEAKRLLEYDIPVIENNTFDDKDKNQWKLIYSCSSSDTKAIDNIVQTITKYIENTHSSRLKVSTDFYTPETTLVVVHGFYSDTAAKRMSTALTEKEYKLKKEGIPITQHNYIVIQTYKNFESYIELNK